MDEIIEALVGFVDECTMDALSSSVIHETKRRLVDSMGCIFGGFTGQPAVIARNLAGQVSGTLAASAVGLEQKTTLEMAAFSNAVMIRYLDFNDVPHLSECIPAVLAAAEVTGCDGASVVLATVIAYEITAALSNNASESHGQGWDYATWVTVGCALAAGKLFGLTRDELRHAASIASISNISTWARNTGPISMWKACSSAQANEYGLFAVRLAREGITGPGLPFTGTHGIMEMVSWKRFNVDMSLPPDGGFAIETTGFKIYPCVADMQGPVELMLSLRDRISIDEVEEIRVDTYNKPYSETGERINPAQWDRKSRETADHSRPYVLAVALVDGAVTEESFAEERILDPTLRPIMERTAIYKDKEFFEKAPQELNSRLTVRLRSGKILQAHAKYPHGHYMNTCSDNELNEKFDSLSRPVMADMDLCHEIRDTMWTIDSVQDLSRLFSAFRRVRSYEI